MPKYHQYVLVIRCAKRRAKLSSNSATQAPDVFEVASELRMWIVDLRIFKMLKLMLIIFYLKKFNVFFCLFVLFLNKMGLKMKRCPWCWKQGRTRPSVGRTAGLQHTLATRWLLKTQTHSQWIASALSLFHGLNLKKRKNTTWNSTEKHSEWVLGV